MTNMIENKGWRVADRAAEVLRIDRDVCRRAFHQVPEKRVHEVVLWVLSERNLSGYDPEQMIERWAREHGAGVYGQNRRRGNLEQVEGLVARAIFGRHAAA